MLHDVTVKHPITNIISHKVYFYGFVLIHKHRISKVFEKFTQVHDTSAENLSGGGLGLALVKSFVHHLDGHIAVQSELGVGTEFVVSFPSL